ncbi:winged helix-turn-helix transcriptional regulator [Glycomyces paridis]|uniref:Helix-turn-helix transcriptional regulator n=1 Tax=Glycomyces paridis TaxID=2126555 RepID=A0A4S8P3T7_9ACTN|nr:helix-turn-helix domain-containing protein [Glycomyces paridis]THV23542.1 helix-turn-helix transcriptional regulator [Glycomyces paridis]
MSTRPGDTAPAFQVTARGCDSRVVLDHVTGRWGTLILLVLHDGPMRFSEIRRAVEGVNEKALAQNLRQFERDGLVARLASDGYPSRVEYRLTETGAAVEGRLRDLVVDLYGAMPEILAAQAEYDARHAQTP